jgi:hypothetical protein
MEKEDELHAAWELIRELRECIESKAIRSVEGKAEMLCWCPGSSGAVHPEDGPCLWEGCVKARGLLNDQPN